MKRKIVIALCAALTISTVIGGCGTKDTNESGSASSEEEVSADAGEEESVDADHVYTADDVLSPLGYKVEDYVVLNDYMNMTVSLGAEYTVTDADIEELLEAFANMYNTILVDSDKTTVADGDIVNIDYTGYLNGEAFDGGSGEDYDLEIGSDTFVDGFEDGLIDAKVGDTVTVNVTFPDDYGVDSLNGQDVSFEVTVNKIKEKQEITYGEISDQWVKDNFYTEMGISTMDEFRQYLSSYLSSLNETDEDDAISDAAVSKMLEECEITIPDGYLEQRIENYKESVYAVVEKSGSDFETAMGTTEDAFLTSLPANMQTRVKKDLILEALVKDMEISFTQSEFDDYVNTWISSSNGTYETAQDLYDAAKGASELTGKEYVMLSYAEHQAWAKVTASLNEE